MKKKPILSSAHLEVLLQAVATRQRHLETNHSKVVTFGNSGEILKTVAEKVNELDHAKSKLCDLYESQFKK